MGIAVIADQNLIGYAYYHALARPFGPTLQTDQVLGGGVLWILGDLVGLPFLAAQLIHFMREDESDAARIDAELDTREAAELQPNHPPLQANRTTLQANRTTAVSAALNPATPPDDPDHPAQPDEPAGSKPWSKTTPASPAASSPPDPNPPAPPAPPVPRAPQRGPL